MVLSVMEKSWKLLSHGKSNGNWHEAQRLWNIDHVAQIGTAYNMRLVCALALKDRFVTSASESKSLAVA